MSNCGKMSSKKMKKIFPNLSCIYSSSVKVCTDLLVKSFFQENIYLFNSKIRNTPLSDFFFFFFFFDNLLNVMTSTGSNLSRISLYVLHNNFVSAQKLKWSFNKKLFIFKTKTSQISEAYLEPSRTFTTELFCRNS